VRPYTRIGCKCTNLLWSDLVNHLFRIYAVTCVGIALKLQLEDVFLRVDTALPCGLILNELVTNTLKHAFPDDRAGTVHISLQIDNRGYVRLEVKDDGVGVPLGLDFRKTDSLGLQLVNTLTGQLGGTVAMQPSDGTTFLLTFVG